MPKVIGRIDKRSAAVTSYWPLPARRLFVSLQEVPWIGLTAIGTLLGVVILFTYFQSIDYFPSDFSALFGIGIASALVAIACIVVLALGLFLPSVMYQDYVVNDAAMQQNTTRIFSEIELISLQIGGVALVFGISAYKDLQDCGVLDRAYTAVALIAALLWLFATARIAASAGTRQQRIKRVFTCCVIGVFSSLLLFVLLPVLPVFASETTSSLIVLVTLWLLAIIGNALAARQSAFLAKMVAGIYVVAVLFILLPWATASTAIFPNMLAEVLGVRHERQQELKVPPKTCELVQSARGATQNDAHIVCVKDSWGTVNAQVLSNVGDQWLIELPMAGDAKQGFAEKLRLTVPKSDIQIVRIAPNTKNTSNKRICTGA